MTVLFIIKLKPHQPRLPTAFRHLIPNTFHSSLSLAGVHYIILCYCKGLNLMTIT